MIAEKLQGICDFVKKLHGPSSNRDYPGADCRHLPQAGLNLHSGEIFQIALSAIAISLQGAPCSCKSATIQQFTCRSRQSTSFRSDPKTLLKVRSESRR